MKNIFIGIDWADEHHDICHADESGNPIKEFRIQNSIDGFMQLKKYLTIFNKEQILIAIEINHGLLFDFLIENQYTIFVINPGSMAAYRKKFHVSFAKNDKIDASTLANVIRTDRNKLREFKMNSDTIKMLKLLSEDRERFLKEKIRLELQLIDTLKLYYPVALKVFSDVTCKISLTFIETYSCPTTLKTLTLKQLQCFLKTQHYSLPARANQIFELLKQKYPEANDIVKESKEHFVKSIVPLIRQLKIQINQYDKKIKNLYEQHSDKDIFQSLPGVANILGPKLMVCFGDEKSRYASFSDLQKLSGTAPITRHSGKSARVVLCRFACNKYFRHTMDEMAFASLKSSCWAKQYYKKQRSVGKRHSVAIRALGNKWIRVIYKLWQDNLIYNEDKHLSHIAKESFKKQFVM